MRTSDTMFEFKEELEYLVITLENEMQAMDVVDVLIEAEEEGTLDFAFSVHDPRSFNDDRSLTFMGTDSE